MLLEEAKAELISFFDELNIEAEPLSKKEIKKHKEEWINRFSPANSHKKEIKKSLFYYYVQEFSSRAKT